MLEPASRSTFPPRRSGRRGGAAAAVSHTCSTSSVRRRTNTIHRAGGERGGGGREGGREGEREKGEKKTPPKKRKTKTKTSESAAAELDGPYPPENVCGLIRLGRDGLRAEGWTGWSPALLCVSLPQCGRRGTEHRDDAPWLRQRGPAAHAQTRRLPRKALKRWNMEHPCGGSYRAHRQPSERPPVLFYLVYSCTCSHSPVFPP